MAPLYHVTSNHVAVEELIVFLAPELPRGGEPMPVGDILKSMGLVSND